MLCYKVYTFNKHAAFSRVHRKNLAWLIAVFVVAGNNNHVVAFLNVELWFKSLIHFTMNLALCPAAVFSNGLQRYNKFYNTSGARETIFMYPLSRNSRATGPKIRVPRGSSAWLSNTTALSSKLM